MKLLNTGDSVCGNNVQCRSAHAVASYYTKCLSIVDTFR